MSDIEKKFKEYEEDTRIPCQYGVKCYQKNPIHHEKYKHPPKKDTAKKNRKIGKQAIAAKKRKHTKDEIQDSNTIEDKALIDSPQKKIQRKSPEKTEVDLNNAPSTSNINQLKNDDSDSTNGEVANDNCNQVTVASLLQDSNIDIESNQLNKSAVQSVISNLFLTKMPEDFFQFYELSKSISDEDPFNAFKEIHLQLVGPYDVFHDKFLSFKVNNRESLLRHWRYYYDPPEFQTILKCDDDRVDLHFGYWRDDASEKPVFVATNKAAVDYLIKPVAENIFGAVDEYLENEVKRANPFAKARLLRLQQQLRKYAKDNDITLEKTTNRIQARKRKIVAQTFHKAGIVVPYERKTQLGYRDLALTNDELQKLLKRIDGAESSDERNIPMSKLEEVMRLATIAADECDFGTCLELGHDLFCSGVSHVETKALQMLTIAYTHLQRPQLLEIAKAHLKHRRKDTNITAF